MFRNHLKIAWRNLTKHKVFSLINVFGLASGMALCMLSLMQIKGAYDFDSFHPAAAHSYRINTNVIQKNGDQTLAAYSPLPLGVYLKKNVPGIRYCTRIKFSADAVTTEAKTLPAKEAYVDADFYKIFGFTLNAGTPATSPQTVVLTAETAVRFFGSENPIGQVVSLGKKGNFTVTGVLAEPPHPSHLQFDVLASMPVDDGADFSDWYNEAGGYTYVQLDEKISAADLNETLRSVSREAERFIPSNLNRRFSFETQPLTGIVPAMKPIVTFANEIPFRNLVALAGIGAAMLLLAFFNYVNLTLARSLDRAREVGIRKVAGAVRRQLVMQFLTESVLTAVFAFATALLLLNAIRRLPTIERLTHFVAEDGKLWTLFALFALATGLLAGWIPARVLSSFQPVRVLKGKFNAKLFGGVGLRKTLIVTQFAVSLIGLVTLQVFYRQSHYMATADYGFTREGIINMPVQAQSYQRAAAAYAGIAGVESVSATSEPFGFFGGDNKFIKRAGADDSLNVSYFSITPSLVNTLGLRLIAGKNLPLTNAEQPSGYALLNEEACRQLRFKYPGDAVGKQLRTADSLSYEIVGVVKDFHYASFRRSIRPLFLTGNPQEFRTLHLKVAAGAEQTIVPKLEAAWKSLYPHQPFTMDWFDKALYYQNLHEDDLVFIGLLTAMALSIACLGLLGMVMYVTKNRAKEVSIRKVMGAGVWQIVVVVSNDFIKLLIIAVCIGLPIGFMAGLKFLQQYAYRIPVGGFILGSCAGTLLLLGGVTIGWQTFRTASANPVNNLRSE